MSWPRLTETLDGPRQLGCCSSCGHAYSAMVDLTLWQEHDDKDEPEARYILLCKRCSDVLIEKHPRLYQALHPWAPAIGAMPLCVSCKHRDGLRCGNALAQANGGPGVAVVEGRSITAFVDGRGKDGKRTGWRTKLYTQAPLSCSGFEPGGSAVEAVEL